MNTDSTVPPARTVGAGHPKIHRLAAFAERAGGGNPAGVVITPSSMAATEMQRIAAEVGYSETAFLSPASPDRRRWDVRYFAPEAEVPFCGHATIAADVQLGRDVGFGNYTFATVGGDSRGHPGIGHRAWARPAGV